MASKGMVQKLRPTTWLIIIALVVLGVYYRANIQRWASGSEKQTVYNAVFLSNGQVYFGEMKGAKEEFVTLESVYYLQVGSANLQEATNDEEAEAQPELQLIKLGDEVHGPEDKMTINREHIIFYEELKEDSDIVKTIEASQE